MFDEVLPTTYDSVLDCYVPSRATVKVGVPEKVKLQRQPWPDPSHSAPRPERHPAPKPAPMTILNNERVPTALLTPNELWLAAQQQLSSDVAAELERSRAELPDIEKLRYVRAILYSFYFALLVAVVVIVASA